MNTILENITGMSTMTDQVIAYDFLIAAKTGVRNCALALTEAASPDVRAILRKQLEEAVTTHEQISAYLMKKGWYQPYNIQDQIKLDLQNAQTALQLAQ